jgi:hypothetical protein
MILVITSESHVIHPSALDRQIGGFPSVTFHSWDYGIRFSDWNLECVGEYTPLPVIPGTPSRTSTESPRSQDATA